MGPDSRANEALWERIRESLAREGYQRSVGQCRRKWKELKWQFRKEREARREARESAPQGHFPPDYYARMATLMRRVARPAAPRRQRSD
ncbi:trihelix transcription factor GT-4-like [Rhinatrema bivittatum]|uniref:trihelix transcription factor GT-4-like n=1 Tax=Rhinatrema bivittatum TaxID=194408 RepID=UPI001127E83F|nr:trihelix transcription factor GT-4-like [Rhinatrema bivittatum]